MKNGPNKDKKRKKKDVKKKKRALRGQIAWKQKVKRERKTKVFAEAYVALQIQNDSNAFVHDTNQLGCIFFFFTNHAFCVVVSHSYHTTVVSVACVPPVGPCVFITLSVKHRAPITTLKIPEMKGIKTPA